MNICISIAPNTMREAIVKLRLAGKKSGLVEVRIDALTNLDLQQLLKKPRPQVIITNRRESEGGMFTGTKAEHYGILSQAAELGAEYVDVEMSWGREFVQSLISRHPKTTFIVSYHNFEKTPRDVRSAYNHMLSAKADVLKIVTTATDITDCQRMFDLISQSRRERKNLIALCMGERGQISRLLTGKYGGFLTFASLNQEEQTASGQLCADDLKNIFRVHTFNHQTNVFGLVGNPVSQSKGIYFHNDIFKRRNVNAVYVNFLVDNFKKFIETYCDEIQGFSVTMPFKQEVVKHTHHLDSAAKILRAVNTVLIKKGKLFGCNTDFLAIVSLLKKEKLQGKRAVVMGTGGTAKAMAYAAISIGAETTIVGRSAGKAKIIADELGCSWTTFNNMTHLDADILMNGTPVGMNLDEPSHRPATDLQLIPRKFLRKEMVVFDAVYNPPMTKLLMRAKAKGCRIITGLELFRQQAKLQSKLFLQHIS